MNAANTMNTNDNQKLNIPFEEGSAEYLNEMGLLHQQNANFNHAIQCYSQALKINPEFKYAWFNMATSLTHVGRREEAINSYDKALENDQQYKEAWYNKGFLLRRDFKPKKALYCFDQALIIDPRFKLALIQKISTHMELKEFAEASNAADKYLELDYNNYEIWYDKAIALNHLGKFKESIVCLDTAIEIKPDYLEAMLAKGYIYGSIEDYENEIASYEKVFEKDPTNRIGWINKTHALNKLGRYLESLKCSDIALALNIRQKQIWENRIVSLEALELTEEAEECKKELERFQ